MKKYIPTCHCADRVGFTTTLHNHAFVGITTQFRDNGVFIGNMAAHVENNFCPNCGAPRKIVDSDDSAEREICKEIRATQAGEEASQQNVYDAPKEGGTQ